MSEKENNFNTEEGNPNEKEENTPEEEATTYTYNGKEYDNEEEYSKAMSDQRKEMIKAYSNLAPLKTLDVTVDDFVKVAKATFFEKNIGPIIDVVSKELTSYKISVAKWFSETTEILGFQGLEISKIRPELEKHAEELTKIASASKPDPMFKTTAQEKSSDKAICEFRGNNDAYFSHKMNKATKKIENDCECPDGFSPYSNIYKNELISDRGCVQKACDYADNEVTFSGESGTCMQVATPVDSPA